MCRDDESSAGTGGTKWDWNARKLSTASARLVSNSRLLFVMFVCVSHTTLCLANKLDFVVVSLDFNFNLSFFVSYSKEKHFLRLKTKK